MIPLSTWLPIIEMLAVLDSSIFLIPKFNQFLNSRGSTMEIIFKAAVFKYQCASDSLGNLLKHKLLEVIDMFSTLVVVMVS